MNLTERMKKLLEQKELTESQYDELKTLEGDAQSSALSIYSTATPQAYLLIDEVIEKSDDPVSTARGFRDTFREILSLERDMEYGKSREILDNPQNSLVKTIYWATERNFPTSMHYQCLRVITDMLTDYLTTLEQRDSEDGI